MRDEAGITELRLGPPPGPPEEEEEEDGFRTNKKRVFSKVGAEDANSSTDEGGRGGGGKGKVAVVGWPPVCAYRKKSAAPAPARKAYVKVSMDGAPILRKVELHACKGYADLTAAIERLFCHGGATLSDDSSGWTCTQIYEDEDGDWMLVGDVPWDMFMESCRRLRIVKKPVAPWN